MRPITRSITQQYKQELCKNGYHIFKNICDKDDLHDDVICLLNKQINSKCAGPIFNGVKNDKKRIQSSLRCNNVIISEFIKKLQQKIYDLLPSDSSLYFSNWVILKSFAGCEQQRPHTDYNIDTIVDKNNPPLLVLVSLMPETYLDIWTFNGIHKKVVMDKGDVLIFRADLVHAGSSYTKENIRIHSYLDHPSVKRIPNRTWFTD